MWCFDFVETNGKLLLHRFKLLGRGKHRLVALLFGVYEKGACIILDPRGRRFRSVGIVLRTSCRIARGSVVMYTKTPFLLEKLLVKG